MNRFSRWLTTFRLLPVHRVGIGRGGFFFLVGTVLIGAAGMDADANLLMILFGLCCGAILLSFFAGWRGLRGLQIERVAPETVVQGRPFEIRYALSNRRVWGSARDIALADPGAPRHRLLTAQAFVPIVRPMSVVTLTIPAVAQTRGRVALSHLRLSTRFPFMVFNKSLILPRPMEIIALPELCRMTAPIRLISRGGDTSSSSLAPGQSRGDEEYFGIRAYRDGDNPRRIHWRHSARTGQLMIREMSRQQDHRFWCVVNAAVARGDPAMAQRFERAISAAATVICDGLEQGARVGLICNGQPFSVLPPASGRVYRPRLMRELALRSASADAPLAEPLRRLSWPARWRGPCLLFAARVDDDLRAAADLLARRSGPTMLLVPGTAIFDTHFEFGDDSAVAATVGRDAHRPALRGTSGAAPRHRPSADSHRGGRR